MAAFGHRDTTDFHTMTYPEPPHYSTMDHLGLSPEPYSAYPRSAHAEYPPAMGYDNGAVYGEASYNHNMYNSGRASPGMYPDDGDMVRGPASDLSIASASSSNMGSPLSSHGQMAPTIPEWASAPHGLGVTPGIVDQGDYFPGDYSFAPGGIEAFHPATYDFPTTKAPGFVGEFSQIPRSSSHRRLPPRSPAHHHHHHHEAAAAGRAHRGDSISSSFSCESGATVVPAKHSSHSHSPSSSSSSSFVSGLALDTRLAQQQASMSMAMSASLAATPVSSCATSGLLLTPPTSSCSSFSSHPAWSSPPVGCGSPARPSTPSARMVSPFFSQSSGHFVPPLQSCWSFPRSPRATLPPPHAAQLANMTPPRADPSLIHPDVRPMAAPYEPAYPAPPNSGYPTSPALSVSASPQLRNDTTSPFMPNGSYQPYSPFHPPSVDPQRRGSLVSYQSNFSGEQHYSGDESREKQRCPHPDCGKSFKDLKAHMLTHQTERPEKCPITTCEYHVKGFARK
jgi:hypothetical protein